MLENHFGKSCQFLCGVNTSGRITRRAEYQHTCLGRDGFLQLLGSHLEVLLKSGRYDNRCSASQLHHLRIAHPVWGGDDHLISVVHQGQDSIAHALLGTVADRYLGSGIVETVLVLQLGNDGLAQIRIACHGGILGVVVVDSLLGSCLDMIGCIEVWFSHTHIDHIDALGFHLAALLRHGQRS